MNVKPLGQALAFIKLLGSLAGGGIVLWLLWDVGFMLLNDADAHTKAGDAGAQMNDWFTIGLNEVVPVFFLALGFFGFIALAVYQRGSVIR